MISLTTLYHPRGTLLAANEVEFVYDGLASRSRLHYDVIKGSGIAVCFDGCFKYDEYDFNKFRMGSLYSAGEKA